MEQIQKDKAIIDRLHSDYQYLISQGYIVLGVFLQGSQNYNLDYSGSDIDTKAILLPNFKDFVLNKKPISTTIILPSNEHIDIKDIRLYMECFRKQNINFVEILFTKYKVLNPEFADMFQPMFDNAEDIAHYNNYKAVNSIVGMVYEKHKALCHPYPTLIDKIEKYGYDNKQLHHMLRLEEFLLRYINGVPYHECLISQHTQYLISVKSQYIYSLDEAIQVAERIDTRVKNIKDRYMDSHDIVINENAENVMNDVLYNVLKHSFERDILND